MVAGGCGGSRMNTYDLEPGCSVDQAHSQALRIKGKRLTSQQRESLKLHFQTQGGSAKSRVTGGSEN